MLNIKSIRATLGEKVTAKLKNKKDDKERVIEFALSHISLTQQQLSELVACSEHERPFAQVAFVSRDAMSELRHFKKLLLQHEVHDAVVTLDKIGAAPDPLVLTMCSLKDVSLTFNDAERTEAAFKVWAPLDEHALFTLGAWSSQDLFVSVVSKTHGAASREDGNGVLPFPKQGEKGDKETS